MRAPPPRPMKPTNPAAVPVVAPSPAPVVEKTAEVVQPAATDVSALTMELFEYVDGRNNLADATLEIVNRIRLALGRDARPGVLQETTAAPAPVVEPKPAPAVEQPSAPAPIGAVMTPRPTATEPVVEEPDTVEDAPEQEDLTIGGPLAHLAKLQADPDFEDPFSTPGMPSYIGGRGIDPDDKWLKPFDRTPEQIEAERLEAEANQRRLEAEHDRLAAEGKMKKRLPMKGGR